MGDRGKGLRDVVYTIGYSGYRLREFVEEIRRIGVELVADIRRFPRSSITGFTALELAESLRDAGIRYKWLGACLASLGIVAPGEFRNCLTPPPAEVLRASGEPLLDKVLGLVSQCGTSR